MGQLLLSLARDALGKLRARTTANAKSVTRDRLHTASSKKYTACERMLGSGWLITTNRTGSSLFRGKILSVLTRFRLPRADTEDLVSQTNQKLLQAHPHSENLNSYAATAARNVYRDHVRSLYPQLTALQSQLKAAFEQPAEYAVWTERKRSVCGRSEWHGRPPGFTRARLMSAYRDSELPVMKLPAAKENAQWARLFDAIFLAFPAPVRLNDLTVFLAAHFGLDRQRFVPPGDNANRLETSPSPVPTAEQSVLDRETVALAWETIQKMQPASPFGFPAGLICASARGFSVRPSCEP